MKKYRIYFEKIEEVEIEKETANAVWVDGRKCIKGKWAGDVYDNWQDAKDELVSRINKRITAMNKNLHDEYEFLDRVKSLTPPRTAAHKGANCI